MTTNELNRINLALEKSGGNRQLAAEVLGMQNGALKAAIHNHPELKQRWRKKALKDATETPIVTPAQSLSRLGVPAEPSDMSEEERKTAEAMNKEDDLLRDGLERLNFTPQEQALAVEFAAFNNKFFLKSADICMSGITVLGIKLQTEMADRKVRLDEVRKLMRDELGAFQVQTQSKVQSPNGESTVQEPSPEEKAAAVEAFALSRQQLAEEEKNLMNSYDTLISMADRIANTHLKGMMLQAMVKFRLRNPGAGIKPGYQERPQEKAVNGSH